MIRSSMIRYYYEFNNVIYHAIVFQIIVIVIITIIAIIIGIIMSVNLMLISLVAFILVSLLINELYNNYFRIIIEPQKILLGNIIKNTFYIGFLLLLILLQEQNISFSQALTGYLIGLLISNFYYLLVSNKNYKIVSIDVEILKQFGKYGIPLTISFALGVLLQNIDKYMITYQLGAQSNGNYSLVFDLVHNYLYMIMGSLGLASLPRMLKKAKSN
ncbi:oligosaccharide flippase family protein, partial [Staphylococcus equorum]|uniref:oligosaccharide flippase family protein n=1 Tax=Staphylococcus equorum TaxID=246432 RepID=UPI0023B09D3B